MAKELAKKQPVSVVTEPTNDEELIRNRAYEFYVERGMQDGHDLEDWFRAKEEVTSGNEGSAAA